MLTLFRTVSLSLLAFKNEVDVTESYCGFHVSITNAPRCSMLRRQYLQAVVNNMIVRFPDEQLVAAGAVLSLSTWPSNEYELSFIGDSDVIKLASLFPVVDQAVDQYRMFKINRCNVGHVLSNLMQRVKLLSLPSSKCERGFSVII